ncbi:hypothetical protein GQ43DRAFT_499432, partial [Delitschia confertaspora ATCC 74209]
RGTSFMETTIFNSFKATGISPLEPDAILKRFTHTNPDEQGSREVLSTSVLSGSDWRKIERLVRATVKDLATEEARKLSQSLQSITVQNQLLKHENERLKESLTTKKKHQKRGKSLDLQQRKEYHGGAVSGLNPKQRAAAAALNFQIKINNAIQLHVLVKYSTT